MINERRFFWLLMLGLMGVGLYLLQDILAPFLLCAVIAYMFDPLVDRLEKIGLSRALSATAVFTVCMIVLGLIVLILVPLLIGQVLDLVRTLPTILGAVQQYIDQLLSTPASWASQIFMFFGVTDPQALQASVMSMMRDQLQQYGIDLFSDTTNMLRTLATQASVVGDGVSMIILIPIILFYFLRDWDRMRQAMINLLPKSSINPVLTLSYRCNLAISGFFRGQLLVVTLLGALYGLSLGIIGLPYGFIIGLVAGLISFIPYVGALVGLSVSLIVSLVYFPDWHSTFLVVGVFVVGQVLESMFLTPKFIGDSINLHPVWLIFGLLAGGSLLGFTGLLLAIPTMAVVAVIVRFSIEQYQASHFFDDV